MEDCGVRRALSNLCDPPPTGKKKAPAKAATNARAKTKSLRASGKGKDSPDARSAQLREYKGQLYTLTANVPHICRNGREVKLEVWHSHCADCGDPFTFTRASSAKEFWPNRRCDKHKAPGCRANRPTLSLRFGEAGQ